MHPSESGANHELFLMCDNVEAFIGQMAERGVVCADVTVERWGSVTRLTLPGGGALGVYQPSHPSPVSEG